MLDHLVRHPALTVVVAVLMYVSWRTGSLVWQLQCLYGAGATQLWSFTLILVFMAVNSIDSVVEYMSRMFDLVHGCRPKAALTLGVVALLATTARCLGHFSFWILSRTPWAGSTDGFLELQVNATTAISMAFALAAMTIVLPIYYEVVRLVVFHDLISRWLPRRSLQKR